MRATKFWLLVSSLTLLSCTARSGQPFPGPIVDAHGHLGASFDWKVMVETMDSNNVTQRTVMARYYPGPKSPPDLPGSDEDAVRLAERYPGRYFGIGEFIVRHWAYTTGLHAEQENPIYSTFMRRMSAIAARFEVPMVVHMEGYPVLVDDFSKLLSEYPKARFVWAHNCGRSKAPVIRGMLSRHPNLFCDLAGMTNVGNTGYGTGWPRMEEFTALIEKDGVLFPDMKALYEEFPDRFMLGMDVAHAPGNNLHNYSERVRRFRDLLGQLKPETAKKFAETNAIHIFKLSSAITP